MPSRDPVGALWVASPVTETGLCDRPPVTCQSLIRGYSVLGMTWDLQELAAWSSVMKEMRATWRITSRRIDRGVVRPFEARAVCASHPTAKRLPFFH
jgi:hypothetical protein